MIDWFLDSQSTTVQHFTIIKIPDHDLSLNKLPKSGHWYRNHPLTSINSWQKHKICTTIDKPPVQNKRTMLHYPIDFGELTIDGFTDTSALASAISEADLRKIQLLAPQTVLNDRPTPDIQVLVANEHLETPSVTNELQFEATDILLREQFIIMTNLTNPSFGLISSQWNSTKLDMRQRVPNFLFFPFNLSMQTTNTLTLSKFH